MLDAGNEALSTPETETNVRILMSFHQDGLLRGRGSAITATGYRPRTASSPLAAPATPESRRRRVEAVPVPRFSTARGNGNWEQPPKPIKKPDHSAIKMRAPAQATGFCSMNSAAGT